MDQKPDSETWHDGPPAAQAFGKGLSFQCLPTGIVAKGRKQAPAKQVTS
jgi:hypothetical protein